MENEIWKDIPGFNGYYQVSNYGRVKSMYFNAKKTLGYNIKLNPNNLSEVNHKDENPKNNNACNLEWCSHKYNMNYGTKIKRQAEKIQIPVSQYDIKGRYIKTYKSIKQAHEETGIDKTGISMCSRGLLRTSGGYIWKKGGKNER